ncbi:MAG TPA: (d)CMP kinase [Candidatus Limnocylindrales bacterium]|nr:(d)CMP kinase [Candidatus Limnocylindrales bacterium]
MSEPSSHEAQRGFLIALDGPAGAGKSTTAQRVADALGFGYLDSGALYRCVAVAALEDGVALDDDAALGELVARIKVESIERGRRFLLNGRDVTDRIRAPEISQAASKSSACPTVRRLLVEWQRNAAHPPGTVVEGRDIGTVIFPDADLKVFLDADPEERARRRSLELAAKQSGDAAAATVAREMAERDRRDSTRPVAPLAAAPDAVVLDTTRLEIDQVVSKILAEVALRRSSSK